MKKDLTFSDQVLFHEKADVQKIFAESLLTEYRATFRVKIQTEVAHLNLHIQKSGKSNKGFYIALGVCLIAVGVAAWTTYDSVSNYAVPEDNSQSQTTKANDTVSGIFVTESSEPSSSAAPASSVPPVSSQPPAVSHPATKPASITAQTFSYPVGKTILQKFSKDPVFNKTTQDWRAHTGIDLSAAAGTSVTASADGTVRKVYQDDQYGNIVAVSHGSYEFHYCGLAQTAVKAGDAVAQGQKLGTVGSVPIESQEASHLHLEVLKDGQYVDPLSVLE